MKDIVWVFVSMILVFLAGVALLLALAQRASERREVVLAVMEDLQVFEQAFERYYADKKAWPPSQVRGKGLPKGLEKYIGFERTRWLRETPVGGRYFWNTQQLHNGVFYKALIGIETYGDEKALRLDNKQLIDLDERIDDGNLLTGKLRLGRRDYPVYLLAE